MSKGNLVRNQQGELGIVLAAEQGKVLVMMGDGLTVEEPESALEVVPFGPGHMIPACFIELVDAYQSSFIKVLKRL